MQIILERHTYAPELNKAYIGKGRICIPTPGCKTISEVRKSLFAPLKFKGRYVTLSAVNTPDKISYNRQRTGFCQDMHSLSGAIRIFKDYHNLPGCKHIVKTRLIG